MAEEQKKYWTDDPELVEKYVLGQLSDDERKRFDAEIVDCEPCKTKLRHELELAAGIRRHGRDQLKSRLRLRLRKEQSQLMYRYQYISLAAAVVVIAIGVGVYRIWFSDITAPKKFTSDREIVFTQPETEQQEFATGGETATEEKKDEGKKLTKRDNTKKEVVKSNGASSKGQTRKKAKMITAPSTQGAVKMEERLADAKPALEISENAEPVLAKKSIPTQSIWLIGKVVMVADKSDHSRLKSSQKILQAEESETRKPLNEAQASRTLTVKRGDAEEQIVLQQRSFRELPPKRQTQMARKNLVETLVQQSADGLSLTIYSDVLSAEEIESATVETAGSDSLIIATASQRIYYRLPAEFQLQTRMRR